MGFRSPEDAQGFAKFVSDPPDPALTGTPWQRGWKRGLDIAGALGLLILTGPLILVAGLLVRMQDGHVALFTQERIGRAGRRFRVYKLRTMVPDAQTKLFEVLELCPEARKEWTATQKLAEDPRVTTLGWFLRKSSIDELPQLINILKGDMSLVGPRPIVQSEVERYGRAYPAYCSVAPGLTGVWQVEGRSDTTYAQRIALDVSYAETWSVRGDLAILLKTIPAVLRGRGAQ
jgi:exopolysaccharide production protein ExoY